MIRAPLPANTLVERRRELAVAVTDQEAELLARSPRSMSRLRAC